MFCCLAALIRSLPNPLLGFEPVDEVHHDHRQKDDHADADRKYLPAFKAGFHNSPLNDRLGLDPSPLWDKDAQTAVALPPR